MCSVLQILAESWLGVSQLSGATCQRMLVVVNDAGDLLSDFVGVTDVFLVS